VQRALEMNDLSTAQELLEKVLEADPTDTQARMMKSSLEQERKRQQLQEIAEEASRALAVRAFVRVREFIQQLEALDPTFAPLASLKKAVWEGEAEEKRRIEIENLVRKVHAVLESGDVPQSLSVTEQALAASPGEPRLLRLRAHAEALRDAAERERAIQEQLALAQRLAEKKDNAKALAAAENAVKQLGADHRLQALVAQLRAVVDRERQGQAEQLILAQANNAIREADFDFAAKILTAAQADFPNSRPISDALQAAQIAKAEQAEAIQRDRRVQAEGAALAQAQRAMKAKDFESAVKILSAAGIDFPNSKQIADALQSARAASARQAGEAERQRKLQAEKAAVVQAGKFIKAGDFDSALKILTPARLDFPNSKEIADALQEAQAALARNAGIEAQNTRKREIAETLNRALANESDPELQVRLAEEAARRSSGNDAVAEVLARVRDRQSKVASAVDRANQFEQQQRYKESIQQWESVRKLWPQCPHLDAQVARLNAALKAPAVGPPARPSSSSAPRVSATSIMAAPQFPAEPAPQPAAAVQTGPLQAVESKRERSAAVELGRRRPQQSATDLLPSLLRSRKLLLAIAAALAVGVGLSVLLRSGSGSRSVSKEPVAAPHSSVVAPPVAPAPPAIGKLTISTNVDDADILVDGDLKPGSGGREQTIPVVAGIHKITVEKRGYDAPTEQQVEIVNDHVATLRFNLAKSVGNASDTEADTYFILKSQARAKVRIDGNSAGEVQPDGSFSLKTTPGSHQVALTLDGYQPLEKSVTVKAGNRRPIDMSLTAIPAPVIAFFRAASTSIQQGQQVKLEWKIQNAASVKIDQGIGTVQPESSVNVNPNETTTYTLTAAGEGGTQSGRISITVAAAAKPTIDSFEPGAEKIPSGGSVKLYWSSQNAKEGVITSDAGDSMNVGAQGPKEVKPTKTTTYTLVVKGLGGSSDARTAHVTVEVAPAPVVASQAPPTTSLPPPAATADPEIDAVLDTLRGYQEAFEAMDLGGIKKVFPQMPRATQKDLEEKTFKIARAIQLHMSCKDVIIKGDSAECTCSQKPVYLIGNEHQKVEPFKQVFKLQKEKGRWMIVSFK
jgi:hypothetical protein